MTQFQQAVLALVLEDIFRAEYTQQQKEVDELIAKNKELLGPDTDDGFWYMDRWFAGSNTRGLTTQGLHRDLDPTMQRLVHHMKRVQNDQQIISQVLAKLICTCTTKEEARNELPDTIIDLDQEYWADCPRTRPEALSIKDNPRDVRQYQKVLLKIRSYCALRFVL